MVDEAFDHMRDAVYHLARAITGIETGTLDRDHRLRALLFAVFSAGAAWAHLQGRRRR